MRNAIGLGVAAALLAGATAPPAERVVSGDGVVAVTLNGATGRVRIDPAVPAMPLFDADFAARAGLKGGMFGISYGVGPRRVSGRTAVARIDFGTGAARRRVGWTPIPFVPHPGGGAAGAGVDGVVGPAGLPDAVIRFVLRPAIAGERTVALPMTDQGGMMGGWAERFAVIEVGGLPMRVRFDPHHRRTLATAGAGARLAAAFEGRLSGETSQAEIAFGIERPVRDLSLARPVTVGPLRIAALGVRTADNGSTAGIADADAPAPDPDEIVVTGKKKRDPARDRLAIGADQLDRCSSIVFDKPANQIRLTCG